MEATTNARQLFIIEIIMNYLQSVYPHIYSDKEIIRKYIQYNKLINKKYLSEENKNVKFTNEDKEKLDELNILFFGNEDGTNSSYADLPGNYLMTIRTIKELINSTNKSIQDTISTIYSLFDNNEITENSEALNYYLNEIIIPSLLISLDSNYINENINTKISNEEYTFDKYKEIENEEIKRIEREKAEKENEKKKLEEKEKKLIEKRKEEKKEQEKLNEKIKTELEEKKRKEKSENETKKRNDIKKIKKELDDKLEQFKLNIILNSSSKLKAVINKINNYSDCNNQLLSINDKDDDIKKFLMKYCEILKLRGNINDTSDIKEINSFKEKINNKIKDLAQELGKFAKKAEISDEKLIINKKIKEMDIFFNKDYSDYNEVFFIEKTKKIVLNNNYKELKDLIIEFNKLKLHIIIYELDKRGGYFQNYIKKLYYYFNVLKILFKNMVEYKLFDNTKLFINIIEYLIDPSYKNKYFKINDNIKILYDKLIKKIKSINKKDINKEDIEYCIINDTIKEINTKLNEYKLNEYKKIFDIEKFKNTKNINDDKCKKTKENDNSDENNDDIKNIYLYFFNKYNNILIEINNILNQENKYNDNYQSKVEYILSKIILISKYDNDFNVNVNVKEYLDYIKSIDTYDKFINNYFNEELTESKINNILIHLNNIYINKF